MVMLVSINDRENDADQDIADDEIRFDASMAIRLLKIAVWCLISDRHT